ncbi:MAG: TIGR01212 family radical SAM protein [Lachnospiraceae bacterium]|nr:TIGR01212 family radical SAM protein [Lachnospiraceae bacterium]
MNSWNDKPYYSLNAYLKHTYGEKLYKIALDGGMTCPNRDGTLETRGCIFCSRGGSGEFTPSRRLSITEQIEAAKQMVRKKQKSGQYIAYFQAFTNTYAPVDYLERIFMEAITHPDVAILSIATRPDCLSEEILALLSHLNQIKPVWIELGLQTIHERSAGFIRRGYNLPVFDEALKRLQALEIPVIVHVILGLPHESRKDMQTTISYLAHAGIQGIKLQLLHVLKGTDLADYYMGGNFEVLTLEEYLDILIDAIELLPPDVVIHRLTGDGPEQLLIAPLWSLEKWHVLNTILDEMKKRGAYQGRRFS